MRIASLETHPTLVRGANKSLAVVVESKRRSVIPVNAQAKVSWFLIFDRAPVAHRVHESGRGRAKQRGGWLHKNLYAEPVSYLPRVSTFEECQEALVVSVILDKFPVPNRYKSFAFLA